MIALLFSTNTATNLHSATEYQSKTQHVLGYGGPRQFLQSMFPTRALKLDFAKRLVDLLPADASVNYIRNYEDLPTAISGNEHLQSPFSLHLSLFSFENDASLREPTSLKTFDALLGSILADGFQSSTEPVFVKLLEAQIVCKKLATMMHSVFECWVVC